MSGDDPRSPEVPQMSDDNPRCPEMPRCPCVLGEEGAAPDGDDNSYTQNLQKSQLACLLHLRQRNHKTESGAWPRTGKAGQLL